MQTSLQIKITGSITKAAAITLLLILVTAAGCKSDNDIPVSTSVKAPPSIQQNESNQMIKVSAEQAEILDIKTFTVTNEPVVFNIDAPGEVFAAPERISVVSAPINGRVSGIYVHEGERVEKGDPLLELESLEFANLVADYLEAQAEINYQQQQVDRLTVLTEEKISPKRTLERVQADLQLAKTKKSAALARLRAVGLTDTMIEKRGLVDSEPLSKLTLYASISGVLNEHLIEMGESVTAYQKLLDIIDNTEVLVRGYVSPEDAVFLRPGSALTISERGNQNGTPPHHIKAKVTTVNPALDKENKSVVLNSIVRTENDWPVIGQTVKLTYQAQPMSQNLSIPLSAVQFEGADATVFVQHSKTDYEKRTVGIARMTATHAIINSGLSPGEKVAVTQVFSLKALERFEKFAD